MLETQSWNWFSNIARFDADCPVIDVQMPELTGLEVHDQMKRAVIDRLGVILAVVATVAVFAH